MLFSKEINPYIQLTGNEHSKYYNYNRDVPSVSLRFRSKFGGAALLCDKQHVSRERERSFRQFCVLVHGRQHAPARRQLATAAAATAAVTVGAETCHNRL